MTTEHWRDFARRLPLQGADRLTHREVEVIRLLMSGDRVPMIGEKLYLAQSTVRNHLYSAYRKLGVKTQQGLITLLREARGAGPSAAALVLYDAVRDLVAVGEAELPPIDAWTTWQQLEAVLRERVWPVLTVTGQHFKCPWCTEEFTEPLAEEGATRSTFLEPDWTSRTLNGSYDGDSNFQTLWHACPECARPVSLPEGWRVGVSAEHVEGGSGPDVESATPNTATVTIPAVDRHDGWHKVTVTILWQCPICGGPRGEIYQGISFDGSRRMTVDRWDNPCGHVDRYSQVRNEAGLSVMTGEKLSLIGRDRVWIDKLTKSLRTDIGELGTIYETSRGNTFEVRYGEPGDANRYIAKVTVEMDRLEQGGDRQ